MKVQKGNIIKEAARAWAHYIEEQEILGQKLTELLGYELKGMLRVTDILNIKRKEIIKYRLDNFGV